MKTDDSMTALVTAIRSVLPELSDRRLGRDDSMVELGLGSVDRAEVLLLALEALELDASILRFHGARNLGEVADLMDALRGA